MAKAKPQPVFFNVEHAPIGSFATFTLGCKGAKGGLGLELGAPANESVYIGLESRRAGRFEALPFFSGAEDETRRYNVSGTGGKQKDRKVVVAPFADTTIRRTLAIASDTWTAGDLTFSIFSPLMPVPDPDKATPKALKLALVPAVLAEITVDNRRCKHARKLFFGYAGKDPVQQMRRLDDTTEGRCVGVGVGMRSAIVSSDAGVYSGQGFTIEEVLACYESEDLASGLGGVGALMADVPADRQCSYRFAICFHRGGTVTAGLPSSYTYTRWFKTIEDVAFYALKEFETIMARSIACEKKLGLDRLSDDQRFQAVHAVHSYYASTQMLDADKPFWVVNEGEYRMIFSSAFTTAPLPSVERHAD